MVILLFTSGESVVLPTSDLKECSLSFFEEEEEESTLSIPLPFKNCYFSERWGTKENLIASLYFWDFLRCRRRLIPIVARIIFDFEEELSVSSVSYLSLTKPFHFCREIASYPDIVDIISSILFFSEFLIFGKQDASETSKLLEEPCFVEVWNYFNRDHIIYAVFGNKCDSSDLKFWENLLLVKERENDFSPVEVVHAESFLNVYYSTLSTEKERKEEFDERCLLFERILLLIKKMNIRLSVHLRTLGLTYQSEASECAYHNVERALTIFSKHFREMDITYFDSSAVFVNSRIGDLLNKILGVEVNASGDPTLQFMFRFIGM